MLFDTIKNTTTAFTVIAICIVSAAVLLFSLQEHETLYLESVRADLDGLSENMSSDLVTLLANEHDEFQLTTTLLRLDRYENVKFAIIYDENWQIQHTYLGENFNNIDLIDNVSVPSLQQQPLGVWVNKDDLIALKRIGDARLPIGYLLINNDVAGPLSRSKLSLLKQVIPLTVMVLVVVMLISLWIQQRLFLPLHLLSRLVQKIQKTNDYSLRIDIHGKKEVAQLSRDINRMMETINTETQKNKQYTQQLMEQQKTMEKLANFDGLTGLPNRQFFMENLRIELEKSMRSNTNLVLMYFDLDGFKGVNDSLGHETGDKLLIEVGKRAKKILRKSDVISRLGGDEFLILLHNEPNDFLLCDIAQRLIEGLNKPFDIDTWEVQIGVSIGIAKATDSDFKVSEFVSNADIAMYRSKMTGRNTHTVFVPEMMEDNKRKLLIANSIAAAIKNNEFNIYYQAKVSADENVVGYEALLRWTSASLGFVSPAEFIPIAEQSGKIVSITMWVLEQICKEFDALNKKTDTDIVLSVNLSTHDIKNIHLIDDIKALFSQYQIEPRFIEFEVTESAYLENFDMAHDFFTGIKKLGSSIALDDFGTGYSSLGYLTQLHIDTLKIDKQFVDNINVSERNTLITKTIIEMAKQLNLQICAEGVETREQADFLLKNGCHQLQGYLFSKPKPLADI